MYRGIVEPHLSYCCSVWSCCRESKISALQKNPKYSCKNCSKQPIRCPCCSTNSESSLAPDYLRNLFIKCSDDTEWLLCSSDTVRIRILKTINGQKAFSFRGAKLWNSLERETKLAPSLKIFKEKLLKGL